MDPFRTGKLVLFQVSYDRDWHYFEIPAYILLGIFGVSFVTVIALTQRGAMARSSRSTIYRWQLSDEST